MNFFNLFSTFIITSLSLVALKPVANKMGLMDVPGGRKQHQAATPLVGGLGIYLGTLSMTLFTPIVYAEFSSLLAISALILFIGILDDLKELSVATRMSCQAIATIIMALGAGNQLNSFGDILFVGPIILGIMALPLTIFVTVGVINAINMSDGIDGLSGGLVLITLSFLGITAYIAGDAALLYFITILACSLLAFLMLNFRHPWKGQALVYLGDAGSTLLGFITAWLLIKTTQGNDAIIPPVLALWFLAIPLMDTVGLLIRRPLEGKSPFHPGRDHLHHLLMDSGLGVEKTVIGMYVAGITLGSMGLLAHYAGASEGTMFASFIFLFLVYLLLTDFLRKKLN